jgi:hypothetical protein
MPSSEAAGVRATQMSPSEAIVRITAQRRAILPYQMRGRCQGQRPACSVTGHTPESSVRVIRHGRRLLIHQNPKPQQDAQHRASESYVNDMRQRHSQRRGHSQRQSQGHALAFKRRCERHGHGHTSASAFTASSSSETKLSVARPSQRRSLTAMRRRQSPTSDFVFIRHASRPGVNADVRGACLHALVGTALLSVKAQCVVCSGLSNS